MAHHAGHALGIFLFTSRKPDFVCSTATMPKNKVKATSSSSSVQDKLPDLDIERYPKKLWTVTKAGELCMALADPPAHEDETYGPYWDVSRCGDHGGPPSNKVRAV